MKEKRMKLKVKSESGSETTQSEPSLIKTNTNVNLKEVLLKSLTPAPGQWAIKHNGKPIYLWNKVARFESPEVALQTLKWHCEHAAWLFCTDENMELFNPKDIETSLQEILDAKIIEIEQVED